MIFVIKLRDTVVLIRSTDDLDDSILILIRVTDWLTMSGEHGRLFILVGGGGGVPEWQPVAEHNRG